MKESYRKGVANHPDPEPCVGVVTSPAKRWTGAYAGWVTRSSELRNRQYRASTVSARLEDKTDVCDRHRECTWTALRSRRPHACIETSRARTERPHRRPRSVRSG